MARDPAGELRASAERLRHVATVDRARETRDFWSLARQIRAAGPPLLLPHRSAPDALRVGYTIDGASARQEMPASLAQSHAERGDSVWLFMLGDDGTAGATDGATSINLTGIPDAHAARVVARADLDVLVDVGGAALSALPLLLALHPARAVVEPFFSPMSERLGRDVALGSGINADSAALARVARSAAVAPPALPVGVSEPMLQRQLEQAIVSHRSGALAAARQDYGTVLSRYPDHPIALYLMGQLLHQQGLTVEAIAHLEHASEVAPEFRDAHYTLGQRLAERQRWREAAVAYRRAVELTPLFAPGWAGLGLTLLRDPAVDAAEAVAALERAVSLEPATAQWQFNLGTALQRTGNLPAARAAYEAILARDPDHLEALFNLGAVLRERGDHVPAIAAYRRLLDRQPGFGPAFPELGACLQATGQVDAWLDNFAGYRAHCVESLPMAVYGLEASMAAGDAVAHAAWRDGILAGEFVAADSEEFLCCWEQLLFLLLHVDLDRARLREWYERYDEAASTMYGPRIALPETRRAGPIRLGYLSGDLRDHVMGRMIYEWVSRHDRSRFAVTLYSLSPLRDDWSRRFQSLDIAWVDLDGFSLDEAGRRIANDEIDVLIDCSGHTRGARPDILVRKPARIQATHIATPGPVGLRAIDYKLTDALSEADDAQRYALERLLPVPGGVFPWHRHGVAAAMQRAPASGIAPGKFVCGAFVSLMKLSPRCLALWRLVLDAVPDAVLAFSPAQDAWRPAYVRWLGAHGIAEDRIRFVPYAADEAGRLARYRQLDVALDPLPCGNVNGTMEALAMGVPVVTLAGVRHGERLGVALLNRFGITDTIAESAAAYVAIVAALADDPERASALRARITELAAGSSVWDGEPQVRHVEAVVERMVAEHSIGIVAS